MPDPSLLGRRPSAHFEENRVPEFQLSRWTVCARGGGLGVVVLHSHSCESADHNHALVTDTEPSSFEFKTIRAELSDPVGMDTTPSAIAFV
jgi:hypothetical protein